MTASQEDTLEHCFVTGGAGQTPGLMIGIENALDVETTPLNPFENITIADKKLTEEMIEYMAYNGCVAMGLGLRDKPK